jgi:hypothetical protein
MLSLNVHVRQGVGYWTVTATLVRDLGQGFKPEVSTASYDMPMTGQEYDWDDLTAVLSAVSRWSGLTMDDAFDVELA